MEVECPMRAKFSFACGNPRWSYGFWKQYERMIGCIGIPPAIRNDKPRALAGLRSI